MNRASSVFGALMGIPMPGDESGPGAPLSHSSHLFRSLTTRIRRMTAQVAVGPGLKSALKSKAAVYVPRAHNRHVNFDYLPDEFGVVSARPLATRKARVTRVISQAFAPDSRTMRAWGMFRLVLVTQTLVRLSSTACRLRLSAQPLPWDWAAATLALACSIGYSAAALALLGSALTPCAVVQWDIPYRLALNLSLTAIDVVVDSCFIADMFIVLASALQADITDAGTRKLTFVHPPSRTAESAASDAKSDPALLAARKASARSKRRNYSFAKNTHAYMTNVSPTSLLLGERSLLCDVLANTSLFVRARTPLRLAWTERTAHDTVMDRAGTADE